MTGDTLAIAGATRNGQWFGTVHRLMKSFKLKLSQGDTVTADIIGYDKFWFTNTGTSQFVYHIVLFPEYFPNYFMNKKLLIKGNKIIDAENNETYKKESAK